MTTLAVILFKKEKNTQGVERKKAKNKTLNCIKGALGAKPSPHMSLLSSGYHAKSHENETFELRRCDCNPNVPRMLSERFVSVSVYAQVACSTVSSTSALCRSSSGSLVIMPQSFNRTHNNDLINQPTSLSNVCQQAGINHSHRPFSQPKSFKIILLSIFITFS